MPARKDSATNKTTKKTPITGDAWSRGYQHRQELIDSLYAFANTTNSRVPLTDWYDTINDMQNGFQGRPVIGGLFSILARLKSGH